MNASITVPSSGAYFEGHFPGRPILPGVAQFALVLETLEREGSAPVALRGIAFARLRQMVLPADRLELAVRELEGARLRIELRREGMLVTNGELLLGQPEAPIEVVATLVDGAGCPSPAVPPLDALLPHRPPMRFLTSILHEAAQGLICTARIPAACALVFAGSAPALVGIEAAAQAAAAWEAMRRWRVGGVAAPRVGYLVALRDIAFFAERIPADQPLLVSVGLEAAAPPLTHYRVEVSLGGNAVVRGMIATYLTHDGG